MKLHSLKLKNFRGYREEINIVFDDLTVFVGKNDVGKSTILEALDIFFNEGKGVAKIDKNDVNIAEAHAGNHDTIISVCFKELPDRVLIDTTVETSLQDEYMVNSEGYLEVIKKYKNGGAPKVFIKANHPTNVKCADLLLKKNLRAAIWNNFCDDLELQDIEIDASKEEAKKIWEKLASYLPVYSLFQSDRKNSDGDNEVQDPLKEAVKQILSDQSLQATLNEVADEVQHKLQEVAKRTLEKLREMDPDIANSLNPVIPTGQALKWQDVFKGDSISGDEDIPINKRGSGVKRLVLLNFFRGEVERRFSEGDNTGIIYAIEEPETSQHTDNQRKLIESLKTLSESLNVQVILTTHCAYIVKQLDFSNLRLLVEENGNKTMKDVLPGQLQYPSLNEVNYIAFNEITEEYHDELYSYIEFQGWKNAYCSGKPTRLYHRQLQNGNVRDEQKVLTEYIRHQIHHPENHLNTKYTRIELQQSIEEMRQFISEMGAEQLTKEP